MPRAGTAGRQGYRPVGLKAAQVGQQVGSGNPIDYRVVNLEHHRHRVIPGSALDHPHLPQGTIPVQRKSRDMATHLG